jgi:phytoene synthase
MTSAVMASEQRTPEEITARSGSSFLVSFTALNLPRRRALTAIYAFCRLADDAADDGGPGARARVAELRAELARAARGQPATPVGTGLAAAFTTYGVEPRHLEAVLDGVQMDLDGVEVRTEDDLLAYCDKVAAAVGLACLPVFGAQGDAAARYAVALGRALQITNIARDLQADASVGRVYVPVAWRAGLDAAALAQVPAHSAAALARVVQHLVSAARGFFAQARRELAAIPDPRVLLAPETMAAVYARLLDRVATHGVAAMRHGRRVRVPRWEKLWLAWRTRRRLR